MSIKVDINSEPLIAETGLLVGDRFKDVETLVEIEYKKRNMLEVHSELIIEILYKLYSTVELTESLINSIFSFHSYHNELIDFTHSIERVDGYYKQKFYLAMPINEEVNNSICKQTKRSYLYRKHQR